MNITRKRFGQRIISAGFAFVLALSTVTASTPFLFAEKADALSNREYALDLDEYTASVRANTGDVDTLLATAESRTWVFGWSGWSDFYALLGNATLKATVASGGEVSLDGTNWSTSKTQTISQFGKVQKSFQFRAHTVGTHTINFEAFIPTTEGVRTLNRVATLNATPILFTAPQPTAPQNGGTVHGDTTTFGWNGVADALEYEVRASKSPSRVGGGNDGELNGGDAVTFAPVTSTSLNKTLPTYGTWFWQVRAKAGSQVGPWSNIWSTKLNAVPTSTIVNPAAGSFVSTVKNSINVLNNSFHVTGTFKDDVAPNYLQLELVRAGNLVTVYTLHGSSPLVLPGGDFALDMAVPSLTDGQYSLIYTPTDFDGAVGVRTERIFNVDNTKPAVSISNESLVNPSSITITASDAGSGVNRVTGNIYKLDPATSEYKLLQSNSSTTQNPFTVNLSTLASGEYYVRYNAVDKVGNLSSTSQFAFTVDKTPPSSPGVSLQDETGKAITNGYISTKKFQFNFVNQLSDGVVRYEVDYSNTIPGAAVSTWKANISTSQFSTNPFDLSKYVDQFTQGEGAHSFAFRACDAANNCSGYSDVFTVVYDETEPVVTIDDIVGITVGDAASVKGTVDDASISTVEIYVDGASVGTATVVAGEFSFDITGLTVGPHNVAVAAVDAAGNEGVSDIKTVTVAALAAPGFSQSTFSAPLAAPQPVAIIDNNAVTQNTDTEEEVLGESTQRPAGEGEKEVLAATSTPEVKGASDFALLGLAWYWWLVLVAALGAAWWFIAAWRRRQAGEA